MYLDETSRAVSFILAMTSGSRCRVFPDTTSEKVERPRSKCALGYQGMYVPIGKTVGAGPVVGFHVRHMILAVITCGFGAHPQISKGLEPKFLFLRGESQV